MFFNITFINLLIKYRASKMKFQQIIAYNVIIYFPIKKYSFNKNHDIDSIILLYNISTLHYIVSSLH